VINSRHEFATGDRAAHAQQAGFTHTEDAALSKLVLPPELEAVVHVFVRRAGSAAP